MGKDPSVLAVRGIKPRLGRRVVSVIAFSGVALAAIATPAFANWTSYISLASSGFQSHRWSDASYTQVKFQGCSEDSGSSVGVDLREDINNLPDKDYGTESFAACFGGATWVSNGTWNNLEAGNYFFELKNFSGLFSANSVFQDTSLDDTGDPDPF